MENNQKFSYTYSADTQDEIKKIRQKYCPDEPDTLETLRKLDKGVTQKGTVIALIFGIVGTLLLGVGMCCTMVWQDSFFALGIVVGIVGIALLSLAYPIYKSVTRKERERIAPEILRLTDELLK